MIRFAALDFETANARPDSACALGLVVFCDGLPSREAYWLIRPPVEAGEFHPFNTRLHGIGPADVAEAPCFDTVWAQAGGLVGDLPLVAHNAAFDMGVLKALFGVFGIPEAPRRYLCSCLLARRVWPQRPTYSLGPFASSELGISFRHHDALEDARTCGKIVTAACALRGCDSLDGLAKDVGLRLGRLGVHACTSTQAVRKPVLESEGVFTGKTVVFTGTLGSMSRRTAVRQVVQNGGQVIDSVDAGVDYLVEGTPDPSRMGGRTLSSKSRKAMELLARGAAIEILAEGDFLEMLGSLPTGR